MKFKKLLAASMAIVMTLSLASCGKKDEKPAQTNEPTKITVWSWSTAAKSLKVAADNYKKNHPNVEIEVVEMGTNDVYDKLTVGFASNEGLPDVVSVEDDHFKSFANKFPEAFADVTDAISSEKSNFLTSKLDNLTINGKIYGFPWDAAPSAMFYRVDIFEKAGVKPEDIKTWDDYIAAGKKVVKATGQKMIPISVGTDDGIYRELLNQLGTFYFDKDGKPVLNSEQSLKAMGLIKKMYDEGLVYNNDSWDSLITATKNGTIASVPFGVWYVGSIMDQMPELKGKWGIMRMPAFEAGGNTAACLGGSNLMVTNASKNKETAIDFAKFAMTDKDTQLTMFKQFGLFPSYTPLYSESVFDEPNEFYSNQKIWKLFADVAKDIPAINFTSHFAETKELVINAMAKTTLKGADLKTTMDELQKQVEEKIK